VAVTKGVTRLHAAAAAWASKIAVESLLTMFVALSVYIYIYINIYIYIYIHTHIHAFVHGAVKTIADAVIANATIDVTANIKEGERRHWSRMIDFMRDEQVRPRFDELAPEQF
jgi:hypothetical protein